MSEPVLIFIDSINGNIVACVAGVIGEGEGERGSREKMRLPRSPSPSPITPATQAKIFGETMYAKRVMKILETNSEALADRRINSSKMLTCRQRITVNIPLEDLVFDRLYNFIHFVF